MSPRMLPATAAGSWLVAGALAAGNAAAEPGPAPGWAEPPKPTGAWSTSAPAPSHGGRASSFESTLLYVTSAAYGVGLGIWLDAELELSDPALLLTPPTVLGVAAPLGAYFANQPRMRRGLPGAITAGLFIGAGEGVGIAGLQMVTSDDPWGFTGMSRAAAIGSTLGGIGGYALGELQQPSPNISAFASSGVVWGTLIGSAIGFGASEPGVGFDAADDWMARGGLVGFNAGLVVTMALSTAFVPTLDQLSWMWLGGGIGALASLPVYLFYVDDDAPPAKRGLLFTATTTSVGIVAGGLFGPQLGGHGLGVARSAMAQVDYVAPFAVRGGLGLRVGGTLF